jgi:hypothetical protein
MMKFAIKFEDGSDAVYAVKPKHLLKAERTGGVEANVESSFRLAWLASGSDAEFEEWLDTVDEIAPAEEEEPDLPTSGE